MFAARGVFVNVPGRYTLPMAPRQPILLTPYRLPSESTLYLGDEEVSAFLHGWRALWHPAALACAEGLPRLASPYDHEEPSPGLLIALPDNPPLMLADDWQDRARAAGAAVFTATFNWEETLANLREALLSVADARSEGEGDRPPGPDRQTLERLFDLPREEAAPFFGIGLGHAHLTGLFEAMQQEGLLGSPELVADIAAAVEAIATGKPAIEMLQAAAEKMLAAREVVYPAPIHLIDLYLPDDGGPWPASFDAGLPLNVLACGQTLERLASEQPERLAQLRQRCATDLAEVLGGPYREREEPLFPIESQIANLRIGLEVTQRLLGAGVRVYGRRKGGLHPQLPMLLQSFGIPRCLFTAFDDSLTPSHTAPIVSWPSHDGKQVDAFTRAPLPGDSPQTYFHIAHHLHQTIMQDQSATLALMHREKAAPLWYEDWLALSRLAPVLGKWSTLSGFFSEVMTGDYTAAASPDDFSTDYLSARTASDPPAEEGQPRVYATARPVSEFASLTRHRRHLDAAWTFTALLHALRGPQGLAQRLAQAEEAFERGGEAGLPALLQESAEALARRLVARGSPDGRGWMVLNPCSFTRRVAVELPDCPGAIPPVGPVKAFQLDGSVGRAVVEVPALGFAWVPRPTALGPAPVPRLRTADERTVRNEHLEAEVDLVTGGLKSLRDVRSRVPRIGQQLVFNPGSTMRAEGPPTFTAGAALGEIATQGVIVGEEGEAIARFRQRLRAWMGRPVLEAHITLEPLSPLEGYPWHNYLGCRFAWRDEGVPLLRGVCGLTSVTSSTRPESPDFLDLRIGRPNTVILPGGLPFHQRHGSRMLDTILITEGEPATEFDLAIALDREQPMQTALGHVSPAPVVACEQGPPHIGPTGWLFHLDMPNLLLSTLRPEGPDGVVATLLEIASHGAEAGLRCVRDPVKARALDLKGDEMIDPVLEGDTIRFDLGPASLVRIHAAFS
jgi:hypothetical protein